MMKVKLIVLIATIFGAVLAINRTTKPIDIVVIGGMYAAYKYFEFVQNYKDPV